MLCVPSQISEFQKNKSFWTCYPHTIISTYYIVLLTKFYQGNLGHLTLAYSCFKQYEDRGMSSERAPIENRLGREPCNDQQLCVFHRFDFGIGWKPPRRCFHPDHKISAGIKSPACHPVPAPIVFCL